MDLYKGMIFDSLDDAESSILQHCFTEHEQIKVKKNEKQEYSVVCKTAGCPFHIACYMNRHNIVKLTRLDLEHSCDPFANALVSCNTAIIATIVSQFISDNPSMPVKHITNFIKREHHIDLPYWAAWKAHEIALKQFYGDIDNSFSLILSFLQNIRENGDFAEMDTIRIDNRDQFNRCIVCYRACQHAMYYCKPILMLDACHIKNSYSSVVLAACSINGEGNIVNIAFGLAAIENQENWDWFLSQMRAAIPYLLQDRFCCISDQVKGLIYGVNRNFPNWEHCFCVKHIKTNIKKDHRYPIDLHKKLWTAAGTYQMDEFMKCTKYIEWHPSPVYEYLSRIDPFSWTMVHARAPKFKH
jgi:MULE transposase domain/MuDR family transposase